MLSRRSVVIVENFYLDPFAVREYALRQKYYSPYQDEDAVRQGQVSPTWWATCFKQFEECIFKSSRYVIDALEDAVGEVIDLEHWRSPFPVDSQFKPILEGTSNDKSCLWNCCFHVKPENKQSLGDGVHNHVTDQWNSVGPNGWAGLIYLSPDAPITAGLHLWQNVSEGRNYEWMTPAENWRMVDSFGNVFNRLVLVRGNIPHSGAGGWGDRIDNGRMYQTFFFRTVSKCSEPVAMSELLK
jgi:hypothetical protein